MDNGVTHIQEQTELGQALSSLNDDTIDPDTRMSGIDLRARLHYIESNSIVAFDTLIAMKLLPVSALAFTRQKKRLSVSTDGKGRTEIVDIVRSKRSDDVAGGQSLLSKMNPFSKM